MSKSAPESEVPSRKGLIVDDDGTWRNQFERYMSAASIKATTVASLRNALAALDQEFFHVALVDLSLLGDQNRDGIEVIRRIYSEPKEGTEAILLTAYGTVEEGAEVASLGAYKVFSKERNLDFTEVVAVVTEAAETAQRALEKTVKRGLKLLESGSVGQEPDYLASKIVFTLGCGYDAVNGSLTDLLRGFEPLVVRPGELGVTFGGDGQTIAIDLWSRMLGQRLVAVVARNETGFTAFERELFQGGKPGLVLEGPALRRSRAQQISAGVFRALPHDSQMFRVDRSG